jgi:lambda family phage tail tape measure protein
MLDAGTITAKLLLNISPFTEGINKAKAELTPLKNSISDFTNKVIKADNATKGWWDTFGRVAVGFTIAYRAMNAFEAGLGKVVSLFKEAIVETGELSAYQAKLAMYYKLASKSQDSLADIFNQATGNVAELAKVSLSSLTPLEELTTGFDELAQAGVIVSKKMTPAYADLISFTDLIAKSTGSSTKQIRQEFQALTEGRIRTSDILARSMKRFNILTEEDLKNLKDQVNTQQIIDKIALKIHDQWKDVKEMIMASDVNSALTFWENQFKGISREAISIATNLKGVRNIFADVVYQHGKNFATLLSTKDMQKFVIIVQDLASALDWLLVGFEKFFVALLSGYAYIRNFVSALIDTYNEVEGFRSALDGLWEAFKFVVELKLAILLLKSLGGLAIWLVGPPLGILKGAFKLLNAQVVILNFSLKTTYFRLLAIPLLAAACALAVYSLGQVLWEELSKVGPTLKETISGIMKDITTAIKENIPTWMKELGTFFTWVKEQKLDLTPGAAGSLDNTFKGAKNKSMNRNALAISGGINSAGSGIESVEGAGYNFLDRWWKTMKGDIDTVFSGVGGTLKNLMPDFVGKFEDLGKVEGIGDVADQTKALADAARELDQIVKQGIPGLTDVEAEKAEREAKKAEQHIYKLKNKILSIKNMIASIRDQEKAIVKKDEEAKKRDLVRSLDLQRQMLKDLSNDRRMQIQQDADLKLESRLALIKKLQIADEQKNKLTEMAEAVHTRKLLIIQGTYLDGIKDGFREFRDNAQTAFEAGQSLAKTSADAMKSAFSDLFFDFSKMEFKDWQDYVNAVLDSILKRLADTLAEIVTKQLTDTSGGSWLGSILGAIGGFFGSGSSSTSGTTSNSTAFTFHSGGVIGSDSLPSRIVSPYIFANALRAHGGLMSNEVPIIAQKGEGIFTKPQMKALGAKESGGGDNYFAITAIDTKSFADVIDRNSQTIIGPIKKALKRGDQDLRNLLRKSR